MGPSTRRVLLFALLVYGTFVSPSLFAQTTTVTGQVVDTKGVPYAGATMKAQLVLAGGGATGQATVTVTSAAQCASAGKGSAPCQIPFQGTAGPITLDSGGNIPSGGLNLQDNSLVSPASTQWLFSVTSNGSPPPIGTGPQACTATLTITGASQNISGSFSACPALSNTAAGGGGLCPKGTVACVDATQPPYNVKGIVKRASDGTWTAGSSPFTVTSASGLFLAQDFAPSASFRGISGGLAACATDNGTATFVNSTTISVTCPSGVSIGSPVGNALIAWGPDDSAGITAATNAALALCASYHTPSLLFPSGAVAFIGAGQAGAIPAGCTSTIGGGFAGGSTGLSVIGGSGDSRTGIVFLPKAGFNFSTGGAGGCFWDGAGGNASAGLYKAGFTVDGMGESLAGVNPTPCNAQMFSAGIAGGNKHIGLLSWGKLASPLPAAYAGGNQAGPNIDIQVIGFFGDFALGGTGAEWHAGFFGGGLNCTNNTFDYGMWWGGDSPTNTSIFAFQNGCIYHGFAPVIEGIGANSAGLAISGATAQVYMDSLTMPGSVPANSPMIDFIANGTLYLSNSQILGGVTSGACTGNTGTLVNRGGNTSLGGPWLCGVTYIDQSGTFSGAGCSGTMAASLTTGGLYSKDFQTPTSNVCATIGNTPGSGVRILKPGTVLSIIVHASAGGVNASDGVFTVFKNGVAQTMVATLGTGTLAVDGAVAHEIPVAKGDIINVEAATQAATTIANPQVDLIIW